MSGRLVGPAAFKAVDGLLTQLVVGSIPIHSRFLRGVLTRKRGAFRLGRRLAHILPRRYRKSIRDRKAKRPNT